MSTTKAILTALWRARNARRTPPSPVAAAVSREVYRRGLADLVRLEFTSREPERYRQPEESGVRWVTIGGSDGDGGTHVQIDGSGTILKGPPALKGQPADNPDAGKPAQGESQEDNGALSFDETAANSSLSKSGKAEHGGATVEIVDHPEGKQWGYAARITKADGTVEHVSNHGQGKGTSWREAQGQAVKALRDASDQKAPATGGKAAESPKNTAPEAADQTDDSFRLERPKNAPHQPKEQQGELFDTRGKSDIPAGVVELADGRRVGASVSHITDLHVDPDRFQYKFSGIDPRTGVTKELKEVTAWNPMFAGSIMVWRDPANGKDYVINGHHRAELARRAVGKPLSQLPPGMEHDPAFKDENGNYNGKMRTMYIAAESAAGARAAGAITNIAEGRGKPIDAAKFMRDSGLGVDGFKQMGISLEGAVAENGAILAGLSNKIFQAVANGTLAEGRALAIGRHVDKPEFQDKLLSIIDKRENKKGQKTKLPDAVVSEMAREMAMAGSAKVQGKDLFGDFESEESLFVERGELTAGLRAAIGADARIFGELGKRGREERLSEAGNVLNQEENTKRAQESAEAAWTFNQLAHSKGPISDAINTYAGELKNAPGRKKTIIRQLTERIRELISNGGTSLENEAGGAQEDRGANRDDASGPGPGTGARGAGSAGATEAEAGSVKEQFSREFARRDLVAAVLKYAREREHYAAPSVAVVESTSKRSKVAANYRPAFGAARCGTCEFYRAGACSHVSGQVQEFDMCDLYFPARHDGQAVEHFAKDSPGQRHLFDESKIERDAEGKFAEKSSGGGDFGAAKTSKQAPGGKIEPARPASHEGPAVNMGGWGYGSTNITITPEREKMLGDLTAAGPQRANIVAALGGDESKADRFIRRRIGGAGILESAAGAFGWHSDPEGKGKPAAKPAESPPVDHAAFHRSYHEARGRSRDAQAELMDLEKAAKSRRPPKGIKRDLKEAQAAADKARAEFEALDKQKEAHRPKFPKKTAEAIAGILGKHAHDVEAPKHRSEAGEPVISFEVRWKSDADRQAAERALGAAYPNHAIDATDYRVSVYQVGGGEVEYYAAAFDPGKHPRGQPGNAGQFGPGGGSAAPASDAGGSDGQPDAKPADATAGQGDAQKAKPDEGAAIDPPTAPPPGEYYSPDPADGQSSRVGVPAFSVPPPPAVPRLPKLAPDERQAEQTFAQAYEADPDGLAAQALAKMQAGEPGWPPPNVFETDAMKNLSGDWKGATPEETLDRRSQYNTALHQTANALAKRAFVRYLDETVAKLPEGQRNVLVTSGGVAAGKGHAIGKVDEVNSVAMAAAAVWDAAGEQNATENDWILAECQARGCKATFVYVHANPTETWEAAGRGVVDRANKKGRMVDARPFVDSYVYGAKNFADFAKRNEGNPNCEIFFIDNTRPPGEDPQRIPGVPEHSLNLDANELYQRSVGYLQNAQNVKPAIKRGGTAGLRIWGE